eukprot:TRINITY_DN5028_c0_g1_i1.p1 TRINITY_DN5028_c0_g1~~TRINITY_DN5028_c0_g1_i1.p1  ORF type:complete len:110 (-),score=29.52 TRINITY_DN5028_c0_g1_i1:127-456(-)
MNRKVVVVSNLKPAKLRGVLSEGMIIAASDSTKSKVEIVSPPERASNGESIVIEGYPSQPSPQVNPKLFMELLKDLKTNEECVATYKGIPWMTSAGPCNVTSLRGADLS